MSYLCAFTSLFRLLLYHKFVPARARERTGDFGTKKLLTRGSSECVSAFLVAEKQRVEAFSRTLSRLTLQEVICERKIQEIYILLSVYITILNDVNDVKNMIKIIIFNYYFFSFTLL